MIAPSCAAFAALRAAAAPATGMLAAFLVASSLALPVEVPLVGALCVAVWLPIVQRTSPQQVAVIRRVLPARLAGRSS